jgi:hypothetical protein
MSIYMYPDCTRRTAQVRLSTSIPDLCFLRINAYANELWAFVLLFSKAKSPPVTIEMLWFAEP